MSATIDKEDSPMKRAALYLRVSTKAQARRDGNAEGYSLPTQRSTGNDKARSLGAVIVEEYLDKDTGRSTDQRPAMKALLERVESDRDIDYVIVFKLDRWARNTREDLVNDFTLEQAGAELISCSEQIDRSNAGRMMHAVLAAHNEYQSRNSGDEIRRKRLIKIQEGGTPGRAPIGYKNVGEGGRRWVETEPGTADLITWCFHAYATGDWSLKDLAAEAKDRGLLSTGGPTTPRRPVSPNQLQRILRRPYYKGIVTFNGVEYEGKHEPIVDELAWQKVQDILDGRRQGEKQREHPHYLKGTIFCGYCESRLCVTYSTSHTGRVYPYYFCLGRHQKRTTCMLKHRPIQTIENLIEDHYQLVQLTAEGIEETADAVQAEIASAQDDLQTQRSQTKKLISRLETERAKLLQAHYADAVPLELLKTEQTRINSQVQAARATLAATEQQAASIDETIARAVDLARNCHTTYHAAPEPQRRQLNQSIFKRILVDEHGIVSWEYNAPIALLMSAHGASKPLTPGQTTSTTTPAHTRNYLRERRLNTHHNGKSPSALARAFTTVSSKDELLAEGEGFEPSVTRRLQRLSRPPHSSALATFRGRG